MAFKMKGYSGFKKHTKGHNDGDDVKMTPEEEKAHREKVLEYNKNTAKPMSDIQKNKIKEQLSKMDPDDPEAKLLQDMLNLPKNK
tara:strand:- start:1553 stop:1807 length:255 start_codon:yes stop_codon:yes gene_type:complete